MVHPDIFCAPAVSRFSSASAVVVVEGGDEGLSGGAIGGIIAGVVVVVVVAGFFVYRRWYGAESQAMFSGSMGRRGVLHH